MDRCIISRILNGEITGECLLDTDCPTIPANSSIVDDVGTNQSSMSSTLDKENSFEGMFGYSDVEDSYVKELAALSKPAALQKDQVIMEFLLFIYEQMESLLNRCIVQPSSRSHTPVCTARQTPPVFGGKKLLDAAAKKLEAEHRPSCIPCNTSNSAYMNHSQDHQNKKTPRRVNLFACSENPGTAVNTPMRSRTNNHYSKNSPSPGHGNNSDVRPLTSSTPAGNRGGLTLADFVTPERRGNKHKKTPKKSSTPNASPLCQPLEHNRKEIKPTKIQSLSDLSSPPNNESDQSEQMIKPSRRITPTAVNPTESSWCNFRQQAVFTPQSPKKAQNPLTPGNFSEERLRLREKKAQLMSPIVEVDNTACVIAKTPSKPKLDKLGSVTDKCVEPDLNLVTFSDNIDMAVSVYSSLISAGKTQDLTTDLTLLIQVLCCQMAEGAEHQLSIGNRTSQDILHSIHNGVYFAVNTLFTCKVLQKLLDASVIRLLNENERIVQFKPEFCDSLMLLRSDARLSNSSLNHSSFANVSFQADSDNSKNFPSDKHFLIFKKQRDVFYEIKRDWENNQTTAGWSFRVACSEKIFQLLNGVGVEVSNYVHLARLFVNQLIVSCLGGIEGPWAEADDDSISLLSQLKSSQPEKYRKLRERFVAPTSSAANQQNKQATFNGQEMFFRLFIDVAKDASFTQHLKDTLALKLLDLNQTEFEVLPDLDCETSDASEAFTDCVMTARLIAKFLGYIHFFPYACNEKTNPTIEEQYSRLRVVSGPQLDVCQLLEEGTRYSRLSVMIPWLVQYLAQMDTFSITLPYYRQLLHTLVSYYEHLKTSLVRAANPSTIALQYVCISWLFNLGKFDDLELSSIETASTWPAVTQDNVDSVDRSKLATVKLVYDCSIVLQSIKHQLIEYVMGMRSKVNFTRKITPLSADSNSSAPPVAPSVLAVNNSIQQELEDNFFHNQAASLKKSVNFLAERISSAYIKEFRGKHVAPKLVEGKLFARGQGEMVFSGSLTKEQGNEAVEIYCNRLSTDLHTAAMCGITDYINKRAKDAIQLLLPSDTEEFIVNISSAVILKQGSDRLEKWLSTNLTKQYITSELTQELHKYVRNSGRMNALEYVPSDPYLRLADQHNPDTMCGSRALFCIQSLNAKILIGEHQLITEEELVTTINKVMHTLQSRNDLVDMTLKYAVNALLSILIALINDCPERITPHLLEVFAPLWSNDLLLSVAVDFIDMIPNESDPVPDCDSFHEKLMFFLCAKLGYMTDREV